MKGESSIVERLEQVMKMEWFFGTETAEKAEKALQPYINQEGTFLVRLNMGTKSTQIEKTPFTITRVESQRFVHTRVYAMEEGGFLINIGNTRKILKSKISISQYIDFLLKNEPGVCRKACQGSPYQSIFHPKDPKIVYQ